MARGTLRIYLGAAPGVGKTYAMLDEAHRRRGARHRRRRRPGRDPRPGQDPRHGRRPRGPATRGPSPTAAPSSRRWTSTRSSPAQPEVALRRRAGAHQHPRLPAREALAGHPGAARRRHHRAVDGQHPAPRVRERRRREDHRRPPAGDRAGRGRPRAPSRSSWSTSPPRRCVGGWRTATSTRADKVDAALGNYFRIGNLTALRELALLWLADKVDDALQQYRKDHHIDEHLGDPRTRRRRPDRRTGGRDADPAGRRGSRRAAAPTCWPSTSASPTV